MFITNGTRYKLDPKFFNFVLLNQFNYLKPLPFLLPDSCLPLLLEVHQLVIVTNLMKKLNNSRNCAFASFLVGLLQYNPSKFIDISQHVQRSAKTKSKMKIRFCEDQSFSMRFAALGQKFYLLTYIDLAKPKSGAPPLFSGMLLPMKIIRICM